MKTTTGTNLENFVETLIVPYGYTKIPHKEWSKTEDGTKKYLVLMFPTLLYMKQNVVQNFLSSIQLETSGLNVNGNKFQVVLMKSFHICT